MSIQYKKHESERLRSLAYQWMQAANSDEMAQRKVLWRSIKDLKPVRPMIHFETCSIDGFVKEQELECQNEYLKNVERMLLMYIKHYNTVGDDIVIEPYLQLAWKIGMSDYGIDISIRKAKDSMGFVFNGVINTPDDLDRLKERPFYNDSEKVLLVKNILEDIFGDILPVRLGNLEILTAEEVGFNPLVGINVPAISFEVIQLLGQKNMLLNFLGIKGKIQPRYTEDKKRNIPTDQNSLFIIAVLNYYEKTKDKEFLEKNYEKIKKAIDWYECELIIEDWYCSWADNIRKKGKVLYTNVLYCKALISFSEICKIMGKAQKSKISGSKEIGEEKESHTSANN